MGSGIGMNFTEPLGVFLVEQIQHTGKHGAVYVYGDLLTEEAEGLQLGLVPAGRIGDDRLTYLVISSHAIQLVIIADTLARAAVGGERTAGSGICLSGSGGGEIEDILQQLQVLLSKLTVGRGQRVPEALHKIGDPVNIGGIIQLPLLEERMEQGIGLLLRLIVHILTGELRQDLSRLGQLVEKFRRQLAAAADHKVVDLLIGQLETEHGEEQPLLMLLVQMLITVDPLEQQEGVEQPLHAAGIIADGGLDKGDVGRCIVHRQVHLLHGCLDKIPDFVVGHRHLEGQLDDFVEKAAALVHAQTLAVLLPDALGDYRVVDGQKKHALVTVQEELEHLQQLYRPCGLQTVQVVHEKDHPIRLLFLFIRFLQRLLHAVLEAVFQGGDGLGHILLAGAHGLLRRTRHVQAGDGAGRRQAHPEQHAPQGAQGAFDGVGLNPLQAQGVNQPGDQQQGQSVPQVELGELPGVEPHGKDFLPQGLLNQHHKAGLAAAPVTLNRHGHGGVTLQDKAAQAVDILSYGKDILTASAEGFVGKANHNMASFGRKK
ncbi:Uncharacterised protein [uncultured Flavonifractor sp.]|nr:Uncharacterised protein [uncultured Flavonifractor sp.]